MQIDPTDKMQLDLRNGKLLPIDAWPVDQPADKNWAAPLVGYDEDLQYNWDISGWLDQVERDGDEYYDVSTLEASNFVRVNTTGTPAIFGVTDKTDDTLEIVPVDEDDAIELLSAKANSPGSNGADDTASTPDTEQAALDNAPDQLDVTADADDAPADTSTTTVAADTDSGTTQDSNVSQTDRRLPAESDIGDLDLRGVMGGQAFDADGNPVEDFGDLPILGFQLIYTTGTSLRVPREEMLAKMDELNIPDWMAPKKVKPYAAFLRIFDDLFGSRIQQVDKVGGYLVKYDVTTNDGDRYDRTLDVRKHIPESECGVEGGKKEYLEIARIQYDKETKGMKLTLKDDAADTPFAREWENRFKPYLKQLFATHQQSHTGDDINNKMISRLVNNWTDSVRIRDACYFIPAVYEDLRDLLQSFMEFYDWLNDNYKSTGQKTELYYIPIMNSTEQQKMVRSSVLNELEGQIDSLFDDIYDKMADDDFAEEVVEEILDERQEEMETVADQYSEIIEGRLSVKQLIREQLSDLEDDKQALVEEALAEHGTVKPTEIRG